MKAIIQRVMQASVTGDTNTYDKERNLQDLMRMLRHPSSKNGHNTVNSTSPMGSYGGSHWVVRSRIPLTI